MKRITILVAVWGIVVPMAVPAVAQLISGSGAAGEVTFWTGASTVSGDPNFLWDNTSKVATIERVHTYGEPWFDVKAYGAVGNGVADDTAAIASAIAACSSSCVVHFDPGTYLTGQQTISGANVTFLARIIHA